MRKETLSPFPFYGGKGRMAHDIAEMLDYSHTSVYVEPFGGACRVLLNKPRHDIEIYNDLGTGLVSFFEALSDKTKADEVIRKLNDMEISEEEFVRQQNYKNEAELDIYDYITKQTLVLIRALNKKYEDKDNLFARARKALNNHEYSMIVSCLSDLFSIVTDRGDRESLRRIRRMFFLHWKAIKEVYSYNYVHQYMYWINTQEFDVLNDTQLSEQFEKVMALIESGSVYSDAKIDENDWKILKTDNRISEEEREIIDAFLEEKGGIKKFIEDNKELGLDKESSQTDSDGQSKKKKQSKGVSLHDAIHKIVIDKLDPCSIYNEGFNSVDLAVATFYTYMLSRDGMGIVYSNKREEDIESFYRKVSGLDDIADRLEHVTFEETDAFILIELYRKYDDVMMYLDPSYLNDDKKNLGKTYAASSSYEEHVKLMELLTKEDTRAKILLSNYDVEPYKSGLTEDKGWRKYEIETFTSIGHKKDNKRTEVLWYNY